MPLLKAHININIEMHSEKWKSERLGKMTASRIFSICGEKGLGETGLSYIRDKVGEELTGISSEREIDNEDTRHGLLYESVGGKKFMADKGLEWCITQKLVHDPLTRFSCTPDLLVIQSETEDKLGYNVITGEVKCPPTFKSYISLFECETPLDVKEQKRDFYYQVLDQMLQCDSLIGYLIIYHPSFRVGGYKAIEFRKAWSVGEGKLKTYPLMWDMELLKKRKELALQEFERIRAKLLNL